MSLSNSAGSNSTGNWGTIFMGPERMRETSLASLENTKSGPTWGDDTEAEYFERIKAKATQKAVQIIAEAQADADSMLLQAQQQGYEQGIAQAQAELDEFRQAAGDTAAAVLSAIESQGQTITTAWEKELTQLLQVAVEAGIGYELSENRAALINATFHSAIQELAAEQRAVVWVNPEDEPVVADIINAAGQYLSERFQTKGDSNLSPGSIVLESNLGRLENTMEHRRALVNKILTELSLANNNEVQAAPAQLTDQVMNQVPAQASQEASQPELEPEQLTNQAAGQLIEQFEPSQNEQIVDKEAPNTEVAAPELTNGADENFQAIGQELAQAMPEEKEEAFNSPLDNLPIEEGSLIPGLANEPDQNEPVPPVQAKNATTPIQPVQPVQPKIQKTPVAPGETQEELAQAEADLAALDSLDDLDEGKTPTQEREQKQAQAQKQADNEALADSFLADEFSGDFSDNSLGEKK